jgi:hypothetical protein
MVSGENTAKRSDAISPSIAAIVVGSSASSTS